MKRLNFVFLILCLMISACFSASPVAPAAALESTPTPWAPPTPNPTETPSIPLSSSATWTSEFTPTVSIAAMGNATREEIVRTLFEQWLRHYETGRADDTYRLDDYEIHRVDLSQRVEELMNPGWLDFVADVTYSVKPSVFVYSHWNAGSAQTGENGWVNAGIFVGVTSQNGSYYLHILGTG
jgi:hypothetical protein